MLPDLRTVLLQIVVICSTARALGWCSEKLRQPRVVGELLAGILLGPSVCGWLSPPAFRSLFPPDHLATLYSLSQIGLLLFMFQVGLSLDRQELRKAGRAVLLTGNVSVLFPLLLGASLAVFLYPRLSSSGVSVIIFALFLGTAISITAFPVLARILAERNWLQTRVGSIAISAAAMDDVTAWCLLAAISARVRSGSQTPLWVTVVGLAAYLLFMVFVVRPVFARGQMTWWRSSPGNLAVTLVIMFLSAWTTERLGIHALFGAFTAGVVLPRNQALMNDLASRIGDLTTVLLLPLFFAYTGLRTSIQLLSGHELWFYCVLIILVAIVGKLLACAAASRVAGTPWREAIAIGLLMNTRGLVELVILNVGLELGVISSVVFSMMVLMALITTFMTTPLLDLLVPRGEAL